MPVTLPEEMQSVAVKGAMTSASVLSASDLHYLAVRTLSGALKKGQRVKPQTCSAEFLNFLCYLEWSRAPTSGIAGGILSVGLTRYPKFAQEKLLRDQVVNDGVTYLRGESLPENAWSQAGIAAPGPHFCLAGSIIVFTQVGV